MSSVIEPDRDAEAWARLPHSDDELALAAVADWGQVDDWTEWVVPLPERPRGRS